MIDKGFFHRVLGFSEPCQVEKAYSTNSGRVSFPEVEHDGKADADKNRYLERQQEGGQQGDDEGRGIEAGGAQAEAELAVIDQRGGDPDDEGGERNQTHVRHPHIRLPIR